MPRQATNEERRESRWFHVPNPFRTPNQRRSEFLPIEVPIFIQGTNEVTDESERAQLLDPEVDQSNQGRPHTRQHEDEGRHASICDLFQQLIWSLKSIRTSFIDRFDRLPDRDITIFQVLFLISLQLLVMAILTMVCLQKDSVGHSLVHSHKWVLGLSFSMCFYVLVVRACYEEIFNSPPTSVVTFVMWSAGVVLTLTWITVLLSFDFLSLVFFFSWLWLGSILLSGFIFTQPLISYCSAITSLCVVSNSIALFITVGNRSIVSVSFAAFVSVLNVMYLLRRLSYLVEDSATWSVSNDVFYIATCIIF